MKRWRKRWQDRWFTGHRTIGPITVYGANAMHWAINISTRWGYLCFHPTTRTFGGHWPWYCALSPNATPWAATWVAGPYFGPTYRALALYRRLAYGHGYDTKIHEPMLMISEWESVEVEAAWPDPPPPDSPEARRIVDQMITTAR